MFVLVYYSFYPGDEAAIDAEMDQIKAHFESIGKRELFMDYITGRDNYTMVKDAAEKHKLDPVESYRRTAGEVEARNVQRRRNYTMEKRLNSLLSETEDVAEKDKIYLNGLVRGNSNSESGMRDVELEQTGEAIRFIYEGDKAIPIAEGFQFDKTKDMQKAMKEYILALRDSGKHFVIREDQVDVRFNQDSGDEFSNSTYTQ